MIFDKVVASVCHKDGGNAVTQTCQSQILNRGYFYLFIDSIFYRFIELEQS